jgi:hypothetical protein
MYLQRRNGEPFEGEPIRVSPSYTFSQEAYQFLTALKDRGQLPGWLSTDEGAPTLATPFADIPQVCPVSLTIVATKNGDDFKYHYLLLKASQQSGWKLQRAWRTDAKENPVEEYPIPQ